MTRTRLHSLTIWLDEQKYGLALDPRAFPTTEEFADALAEVVRNTILNHYDELEE